MRDYQESVTTGQTDRETDAGQSDPYVLLYFAGDTKIWDLKHSNANVSLFGSFCNIFTALAISTHHLLLLAKLKLTLMCSLYNMQKKYTWAP